MGETQKLVSEIESFIRSVGMAETTFGRKAVNDGKLLSRLRNGGSITLETAGAVRRFISSNAPASSEAAA